MVGKTLKNYSVSLIYILHLLVCFLSSHWSLEVISIPSIGLKLLTVLVYLPFLFVVLLKIFIDIKNKTLFKSVNILFYSFCVYYSIVSVIRYLTHNEVKESVYFFVVIAGALAFALAAPEIKQFRNNKCLVNNLMICSAAASFFRIFILITITKVFRFSPINAIVFACCFLLIIPFYANGLSVEEKKQKAINVVLLTLSVVFVLLSGSRASFFLLLFVIFVIAVYMIIKERRSLILFFASLLCSLLLVAALFACNIQDVRKNVVREVWFLNSFVKLEETVNGEDPANDIENDIEELIDQQNEQIDRSDSGRKELMQAGLNELKKNPLFGTGDVLYEQQMNETYTATQSSHNFVIESLVAFGIIGTLLLAALILNIFVKAFKAIDWKNRFYLLVVLFVYLAFSFIQPLFFNTIIAYNVALICSALCLFQNELNE